MRGECKRLVLYPDGSVLCRETGEKWRSLRDYQQDTRKPAVQKPVKAFAEHWRSK